MDNFEKEFCDLFYKLYGDDSTLQALINEETKEQFRAECEAFYPEVLIILTPENKYRELRNQFTHKQLIEALKAGKKTYEFCYHTLEKLGGIAYNRKHKRTSKKRTS